MFDHFHWSAAGAVNEFKHLMKGAVAVLVQVGSSLQRHQYSDGKPVSFGGTDSAFGYIDF